MAREAALVAVVAVVALLVGAYALGPQVVPPVTHTLTQTATQTETVTQTVATTATVTGTTTVERTVTQTATVTHTMTRAAAPSTTTITQTKTVGKTVTRTISESETVYITELQTATLNWVNTATLQQGGLFPGYMEIDTIRGHGHMVLRWESNQPVSFLITMDHNGNIFQHETQPTDEGHVIIPILPTREYGFTIAIYNHGNTTATVTYTITIYEIQEQS